MLVDAHLRHLLGSNTGITPVGFSTFRTGAARETRERWFTFHTISGLIVSFVHSSVQRQSSSSHCYQVKSATFPDRGPSPPPRGVACCHFKVRHVGFGIFFLFFSFLLLLFLCVVEKTPTASVRSPSKWSHALSASCAASDPFQQHLPATATNSTSCCASIQPT